MKKAIIISIQPKWCELIARGEKTIEVRKNKPKIDIPFKCYIYETKAKLSGEIDFYKDEHLDIKMRNEQVIGEFICAGMMCDGALFESRGLRQHCLTQDELMNYRNGKELFGWRISNLVIYDKPKELSEFVKVKIICYGHEVIDCYGCPSLKTCKNRCLQRPPKSWEYVEELK